MALVVVLYCTYVGGNLMAVKSPYNIRHASKLIAESAELYDNVMAFLYPVFVQSLVLMEEW